MSADTRPFGLVIHGGCGIIDRAALEGTAREAACRAALRLALETGYSLLSSGRSSSDAVVAAVEILEDAPEFNAGKGSVLTAEETIEMDAGLMDGRSGAVGGATMLTGIRNPIRLAEAVAFHSNHSLLGGAGAEAFARQRGLAFEGKEYFRTEYRLNMLKNISEMKEVMNEVLLNDWPMVRLYPKRATMWDPEGTPLYFYPFELYMDDGYLKLTNKEGGDLRIPAVVFEWLRRGTDLDEETQSEEKKWEIEAGAMGLLYRLTSSPTTHSSTKYLRQQFALKGDEWALPQRQPPSPIPQNQEALPDYDPYPQMVEEVESGWEVGAVTVMAASEATRPQRDSIKCFQYDEQKLQVVWSDYNLFKHLFFPKGAFKPENGTGRHFKLHEWERGTKGAPTVPREDLFGAIQPDLLPIPCIKAEDVITVISDDQNVAFVNLEKETVWWVDKKELVEDVNLGPAQDLYYHLR